VGFPALRFAGAQDLDPALLPGPVPPVVHPGDLGVPAVPYDVYHPGLRVDGVDLPHGVRAGEEGRLVPHDPLVRSREPLVDKVVEGQPGKVGEVIVGVPPAPPHGPLRPESEVPAVGDGAGERPGRHARLHLPEVLPGPLPADEPPLPQAQHLRVRAEEPRQPRGAGLPVAHDKEDRSAPLQDRPPNPPLPPLAFPGAAPEALRTTTTARTLLLRVPERNRRRACAGISCFRTGGIGHPCAPRPRSTCRETSTKRCPTQRRRAGDFYAPIDP